MEKIGKNAIILQQKGAYALAVGQGVFFTGILVDGTRLQDCRYFAMHQVCMARNNLTSRWAALKKESPQERI